MGLAAFLGVVDGIRVTISIGTYELRISGPACTDLRDIGSCLHPDRIDRLR